MYNLPVLLDLMKVLKAQAPDKTAFEEAHASFRIHGDRVKVEQLDLIGKAVCLGGSGELDTSGEYVKFEFYTLVSQVLARLVQHAGRRPDRVPEQEPVQDQVDPRERRIEVQARAGAAGDRTRRRRRPTGSGARAAKMFGSSSSHAVGSGGGK